MIILDVEDAINNAIDSLNQRASIMNEILSKPVFFDSVEVRSVIKEIELTRNQVVDIGNILTRSVSNEKNSSASEEEEKKEEQNVLRNSDTQRNYRVPIGTRK
tara:strand:- start:146 stop:454 length:309 start_codon:yes stop_codon:yes gene_type:complete